jgi:hypothetical protein
VTTVLQDNLVLLVSKAHRVQKDRRVLTARRGCREMQGSADLRVTQGQQAARESQVKQDHRDLVDSKAILE